MLMSCRPKWTWSLGLRLMVRYSPSTFSLVESRIYVNLGKFSKSWRNKTGLEHHTAATIFDCAYILFRNASFKLMQWDADLAKGLTHVVSFHEIFSQKFWGSSRYLLEDVGQALFSFGSAVIITWNSPMDVIFVQSPSYCWNMNFGGN